MFVFLALSRFGAEPVVRAKSVFLGAISISLTSFLGVNLDLAAILLGASPFVFVLLISMTVFKHNCSFRKISMSSFFVSPRVQPVQEVVNGVSVYFWPFFLVFL